MWSVKKCQQLLGQMLLRATGAKFPPIWKDLQLMQVGHCTVCVCGCYGCLAARETTGGLWSL